MGSGIRVPPMTPTSTSQNNSFAFGDMGGHFMNDGGHRRFNSYSYSSTTSGYGGGNVNVSGYSYENLSVAYGIDEKTMNTLSLINKSRARWGLTESQQEGHFLCFLAYSLAGLELVTTAPFMINF
ncbi:unnamed protein product [Ambrosiozyma monospora]|uniref:Unnamed protein product n=1 Tax=Ambrosiozyma monospora TaxID=43982 RepID=A0ACB5SYS5_AMBMO|nr:unnamed protein product [Ambrosiozyma monospora]